MLGKKGFFIDSAMKWKAIFDTEDFITVDCAMEIIADESATGSSSTHIVGKIGFSNHGFNLSFTESSICTNCIYFQLLLLDAAEKTYLLHEPGKN